MRRSFWLVNPMGVVQNYLFSNLFVSLKDKISRYQRGWVISPCFHEILLITFLVLTIQIPILYLTQSLRTLLRLSSFHPLSPQKSSKILKNWQNPQRRLLRRLHVLPACFSLTTLPRTFYDRTNFWGNSRFRKLELHQSFGRACILICQRQPQMNLSSLWNFFFKNWNWKKIVRKFFQYQPQLNFDSLWNCKLFY